MEQCNRCKDFLYPTFNGAVRECGCKSFTVIDEEGEEHTVFAYDAQSAALKYAEHSNIEGDYYLMNETAEITVNGKPFNISAEPDVYYSAEAKA